MVAQQADQVDSSTQPTTEEWESKFRLVDVELIANPTVSKVRRKVRYRIGNENRERSFEESIFPIYVPPVGPQPDPDSKKSPGGPDPVATMDAYWAKAAEQARNTAKWIATALGAALAAVIGTAPLSPLGGKEIDWTSPSGLLIAVGLLLVGFTIFMVLAVLVPGVTTFGDLMKPIKGGSVPMSIPNARARMAKRAADKDGAQLPIGVRSLNELGSRIRIDEMTLVRIAEQLAEANDENLAQAWTAVKMARGQWLQSLINEATQWVIVGSYMSVKVKSDRARSIGLLCGVVGAAFLIIGYVDIQAPADTPDSTTYAVVTSAATSDTRTKLGTSCDVFTAVQLATDPKRETLTLYVTGGENCKTNIRVELPTKEIMPVYPSSTPAPPSKSS